MPSEDNPFEFRVLIVGGNNTSMAENYYLFFKPLPVGDHTIELQYTRKPPGQPQAFEEGSAKWNIKVIPWLGLEPVLPDVSLYTSYYSPADFKQSKLIRNASNKSLFADFDLSNVYSSSLVVADFIEIISSSNDG